MPLPSQPLAGFRPGPRAGDWNAYLRRLEAERELRPGLLRAVATAETGHLPDARRDTVVSPAGAQGYWQFMPATAARFNYADTSDRHAGAVAAADYLATIRDQLAQRGIEPTPERIAAGYNAGEGAVLKYGDVPPYRETQGYVRKVAGALPVLVPGPGGGQGVSGGPVRAGLPSVDAMRARMAGGSPSGVTGPAAGASRPSALQASVSSPSSSVSSAPPVSSSGAPAGPVRLPSVAEMRARMAAAAGGVRLPSVAEMKARALERDTLAAASPLRVARAAVTPVDPRAALQVAPGPAMGFTGDVRELTRPHAARGLDVPGARRGQEMRADTRSWWDKLTQRGKNLIEGRRLGSEIASRTSRTSAEAERLLGDYEQSLGLLYRLTGNPAYDPGSAWVPEAGMQPDPELAALRMREMLGAADAEIARIRAVEQVPGLQTLGEIAGREGARVSGLQRQLAELSQIDPAATVGGVVGGLGPAMTDPTNLLTLGVGPSGAALSRLGPAGRVAYAALTNAGVNAGIEGALQGTLQDYRGLIGQPSGLAEAARDVGFAAVGGGVLGGGIEAFRGLVLAGKALKRLVAEGNVAPEEAQAAADALRAEVLRTAEATGADGERAVAALVRLVDADEAPLAVPVGAPVVTSGAAVRRTAGADEGAPVVAPEGARLALPAPDPARQVMTALEAADAVERAAQDAAPDVALALQRQAEILRARAKGADPQLFREELQAERLVETARARSERMAARNRAARTVDPAADDLLTAVRKLGGIDTALESDFAGRFLHLPRRAGLLGGIERPGKGLSLDDLAERLHELGFLRAHDAAELSELLERATSGEPVFGARVTPEAELEARLLAREADQAVSDGDYEWFPDGAAADDFGPDDWALVTADDGSQVVVRAEPVSEADLRRIDDEQTAADAWFERERASSEDEPGALFGADAGTGAAGGAVSGAERGRGGQGALPVQARGQGQAGGRADAGGDRGVGEGDGAPRGVARRDGDQRELRAATGEDLGDVAARGAGDIDRLLAPKLGDIKVPVRERGTGGEPVLVPADRLLARADERLRLADRLAECLGAHS